MDTMFGTKVIGGFCGSLLIFLLTGWVAEGIYHDSSHGDEKNASGYEIKVEEKTVIVENNEPDFMTIFETADASKGAKVFGKCKACHKLEDGANGTGPHLYNVVDRNIGIIDGYSYSTVLSEKSSEVWNIANLNGFLENPKQWAPGTKMGFSGLKKTDERANLIKYLQEN